MPRAANRAGRNRARLHLSISHIAMSDKHMRIEKP